MRRMTVAMLMTAVLMSSLPWEFAVPPELGDAQTLPLRLSSPDHADPPQVPPATDLCFCLCMGCPGSAVDSVSTPRLAVAVKVIRTSTVPPDQTHTSDVHSRLFRPPRSA